MYNLKVPNECSLYKKTWAWAIEDLLISEADVVVIN